MAFQARPVQRADGWWRRMHDMHIYPVPSHVADPSQIAKLVVFGDGLPCQSGDLVSRYYMVLPVSSLDRETLA